MNTDPALLAEYVALCEPLLPLATKAYGSRFTDSPQHEASREYTRLLCEFKDKNGSLLDLAAALGVAYAGINRRVSTVDLPPPPHRARIKFTDVEYAQAVQAIEAARMVGTREYHQALYDHYERGMSLARIAKDMNLSSANPLYYGVGRVKLLNGGA